MPNKSPAAITEATKVSETESTDYLKTWIYSKKSKELLAYASGQEIEAAADAIRKIEANFTQEERELIEVVGFDHYTVAGNEGSINQLLESFLYLLKIRKLVDDVSSEIHYQMDAAAKAQELAALEPWQTEPELTFNVSHIETELQITDDNLAGVIESIEAMGTAEAYITAAKVFLGEIERFTDTTMHLRDDDGTDMILSEEIAIMFRAANKEMEEAYDARQIEYSYDAINQAVRCFINAAEINPKYAPVVSHMILTLRLNGYLVPSAESKVKKKSALDGIEQVQKSSKEGVIDSKPMPGFKFFYAPLAHAGGKPVTPESIVSAGNSDDEGLLIPGGGGPSLF